MHLMARPELPNFLDNLERTVPRNIQAYFAIIHCHVSAQLP